MTSVDVLSVFELEIEQGDKRSCYFFLNFFFAFDSLETSTWIPPSLVFICFRWQTMPFISPLNADMGQRFFEFWI